MIVEVKCKVSEACNCAEIEKNVRLSKFVTSILQRVQSGLSKQLNWTKETLKEP